MTTEVAYGLIFAVVVGGIMVLINSVLGRVRMARRMKLATGGFGRSRMLESAFVERSDKVRSALGGALGALGGLMPLGEDDRHKIVVNLQRAGFRSANAITAVLGAKVLSLLVGLAIGLVALPPLVPAAALLRWGAGLLGGLLIGVMLNLLPELVVTRIGTSRLRRIHAGLPDAFDLLIVCLESGLTLERALQRTVADLKSFRPDLARELREASLEMSVHGRTREEALDRLAGRLDNQDFRDLATTVAQSERHGTPLADSLRKLANSVRVKTMAEMQAKMARLPVLLILPTLAFVLPGIMVIVGGPAFVQLMSSLDEFSP